MNKKFISLLIALCLVLGLLPVMSLAEEAAEAKVAIMSWSTMTAKEGGAPMYAKTIPYDGYTSAGVAAGTGYKYSTTGANENDWNIKFEYPEGGVPTLTLKNATLDQLDDTGATLYTKSAQPDAETGEYTYATTKTCSAILPKSGYNIDIKIVLIGDNHIEANNGIVRSSAGTNQYFKSVTIIGENGGKLTGTGKGIGIQHTAGSLVIDGATISLDPATSAGGSAAPIYASQNVTIKNSNITVSNPKNVSIFAYGGDVKIENSVVNVNSTFSSTSGAGAINAKGEVSIKNSNIIGESSNGAVLTGEEMGVTANTSNLTLKSGYYAINGGEFNLINLNSNLEITAGTKAFKSTPLVRAGFTAVAGADKDSAVSVTESEELNAKYVKLTYSDDYGPVVETTTPTETTAPSTEAPTVAPTAAPTVAPTAAPTVAPTAAPTTPPTTGAKAQIAIMSWSTMTAYEGGDPVYAKHVAYEGFTADGAANGTGYKYTTTGASASDWSIKFEYPLGGVPTLTFKDVKLDCVGDNGSRLYVSDGEGGVKQQNTMSAVLPKSGSVIDLKIVLIGDNFIEADNGIVRGSTSDTVYFKSITIVGENGSKLTGTGKAIGIQAMKDTDLTIENANINLAPVANSGGSAAPIYANSGNITIKNSVIVATNTKNACISASGNITLENVALNVKSTFSSATAFGAVNAKGTLTVIDSAITGETNGAVLTGEQGVTISGATNCELTGTYGISAGKTGTVTINGGMIEITASNAAIYDHAPVLASGWNAVAGASKDAAAAVTEEAKLTSKYVKITFGAVTPSEPATTPTTEPTSAPTSAPTTAPTAAPTVAPTVAPTSAPATTAPTTAPTPGETVSLRVLSWVDISAEEGGYIGYLKNSEYQGYDANGNPTYKGWTQVKGSADDWNIKFEWPAGGVPTLTLKDSKLVMLGDDYSMLYKKSVDAETGEDVYKTQNSVSAILPKSGHKIELKIVLEGDNLVNVNNGIVRGSVADGQYFKDVTITGSGKWTGRGGGIGICMRSGYNLTIDGVTLNLANTTSAGGGAIPIKVTKANITIKNATITCGNTANSTIYAETSGNITIENSTLNVYSKLSSTAGAAAIYAAGGDITIVNSTIKAEGANNPGLHAVQKLNITNSDINIKSGYYAIYTKEGEININSGKILLDATNGSGAFYKAPNLAVGVDGFAGSTEDNADYYDETKYRAKWVSLESNASTPTTPSTPGSTTAPTTPGATNPTNPSVPGGNPTTGDSSITVWVTLMAISAAAFVSIFVIGKKKAV